MPCHFFLFFLFVEQLKSIFEKYTSLHPKTSFRISVRQLVDYCIQKGSLGSGYVSRTRALDGIREHTRLQSRRGEGYKKEVSLKHKVKRPDFNLTLHGRIDGVFESAEPVIIEEIKTCRRPAQERAAHPAEKHLAQLKLYGYIYAVKEGLKSVVLQLTYVRVGTHTTAKVVHTYSLESLAIFFDELVKPYCEYLAEQIDWRRTRNRSIETLPFPYPEFRQNQRELAEAVYSVVKNEKILFARAPTGTGKTIATLFPAVKALGLGHMDKIFYLTAKTIGRTVAVKALDDLTTAGLKLKFVVLTAKQKICFESDEFCDMETCPYARGYYDKLSVAMPAIRMHDRFDRDRIETLAREYELCPFELSLDISLGCDLIICDLNYCFDPRVYLKRYFEQNRQKYTFLIDEAHNLHDRLRSMYSASLIRSEVLMVQRLFRELSPQLSTSLIQVNRIMSRYKAQCRDQKRSNLILEDLPEDLLSELRDFSGLADNWLESHPEEHEARSALLDIYFKVNIFLTIASYFGENYKCYVELLDENELLIKLYCLDPSIIFSDLIHRCRSCTLFSATLTPVDYHFEMLFDQEKEPYSVVLPSPFPRAHMGLFLYPGVQTRYQKRAAYYGKIAGIIHQVIASKKGNYLIYFPSYAFLNDVAELIDMSVLESDILIQSPHMTEAERQTFLDQFDSARPVVGFVVMGGIFGEGIDLTGNRLIGAVIVSPGIPQICTERNLIRDYYDQKDGSGFFNSYQMPGFNRVMQAAGRVIRTDTDKGIILLLDERFQHRDYCNLFPEEWEPVQLIKDPEHLDISLHRFWDKQDDRL